MFRPQGLRAIAQGVVRIGMDFDQQPIGAGGHGGGAHTTQEWFRPEGRDLGLKRILLTLCLLLRDPQLTAASQ